MVKGTYIILLLSLAGSYFSDETVDIPELGSLRGKVLKSRDGREFVSFNGVPYAEPPQRWLPAVLSSGWGSVTKELDCTEPRSVCAQRSFYPMEVIGSEDCLFLNIHTPETVTQSLPVLVFFHGGGMATGSGDQYHPEFLMDEDVILVTVNFRLSVLGFFNLGTGDISGNQGVRDAQLALTWVQRYIGFFGGDSSKVTISGQSGGSWLTNLLYISPLSEGLFSGAILQSGTSVGHVGHPYDSAEKSMMKALKVAEDLNCTTDFTKLLECLIDTSLDDLIIAAYDFIDFANFYGPQGTLDPQSSHEPVLPYALEEMIQFDLFQKVPLMIGTTSQESVGFEAAFIEDTTLLDTMNNSWLVDGTFKVFPEDYTPGVCEESIALEAKEFYFNGTLTSDDLVPYLNFVSDAQFGFGSYKYANLVCEQEVPVYFYNFTYKTNSSLEITPGSNSYGMGNEHGSELPYIYILDVPGVSLDYSLWTEEEVNFSKLMCEIWVNFATHGKPTTSDEWIPYNNERRKMLLDFPLVMTNDDDEDEDDRRFSFWEYAVERYIQCLK